MSEQQSQSQSKIYKIPSKSEPGKVYNVRLNPDYCECKGFGYRFHCSHIEEAKEIAPLIDEAEELGVQLYFCTNPKCGRLLNPAYHQEPGLCADCSQKEAAKARLQKPNPF